MPTQTNCRDKEAQHSHQPTLTDRGMTHENTGGYQILLIVPQTLWGPLFLHFTTLLKPVLQWFFSHYKCMFFSHWFIILICPSKDTLSSQFIWLYMACAPLLYAPLAYTACSPGIILSFHFILFSVLSYLQSCSSPVWFHPVSFPVPSCFPSDPIPIPCKLNYILHCCIHFAFMFFFLY